MKIFLTLPHPLLPHTLLYSEAAEGSAACFIILSVIVFVVALLSPNRPSRATSGQSQATNLGDLVANFHLT